MTKLSPSTAWLASGPSPLNWMNQKEFCEIQKQFRIIKYIEEHDSIIRTRPKVLLEEQLFESVG